MKTIKVTAEIDVSEIRSVIRCLKRIDSDDDGVRLDDLIKAPGTHMGVDDLHLWLSTLKRLLIEKAEQVEDGEAI